MLSWRMARLGSGGQGEGWLRSGVGRRRGEYWWVGEGGGGPAKKEFKKILYAVCLVLYELHKYVISYLQVCLSILGFCFVF